MGQEITNGASQQKDGRVSLWCEPVGTVDVLDRGLHVAHALCKAMPSTAVLTFYQVTQSTGSASKPGYIARQACTVHRAPT